MMTLRDGTHRFIEIEARGKLTRDDYARLGPELDQLVANRGRLRVLIRLEEFEGWTVGAAFEELRLDIRHRRDFERTAVVGDSTWEKIATRIAAPLFSGEVRYFAEPGAAVLWLSQ
jgi:hypothetical protein